MSRARHSKASQPTDPGAEASARLAGLRYSTDETPGIQRKRHGAGFSYWSADGQRVRDRAALARIRALVIPPAWTRVWISPIANGHMQATGRDARGRKQYRYHARWREVRDDVKYGRLPAFAAALPGIRRRTAAALRQPGLTRDKILAALVQLLEKTLIRIGNDEYARTNGSFGLTTMRNRHVNVKGSTMLFAFRAKSGVQQSICLQDPRLARIVRRCQDLPGQTLFQYEDDEGQRQSVDSGDVNDYLRALTGQDFTAKDFRTWSGTVLAAQALTSIESEAGKDEAPVTDAERKRRIVQAVETVAKKLGNTKAVCRRCYIHPGVIEAYVDGRSLATPSRRTRAAGRRVAGLSAVEVSVLALLEGQRRSHSPAA